MTHDGVFDVTNERADRSVTPLFGPQGKKGVKLLVWDIKGVPGVPHAPQELEVCRNKALFGIRISIKRLQLALVCDRRRLSGEYEGFEDAKRGSTKAAAAAFAGGSHF